MADSMELCVELSVGWSSADIDVLERELWAQTEVIERHVVSCEPSPSHIDGTVSLCVPITPITDPDQLYGEAAGTVAGEKYEKRDLGSYWMTVHWSEVPVIILLPKVVPAAYSKLEELRQKAGERIGRAVGGRTGMYLQWNSPGFSWRFHTDDEYEGVASRVHVPLRTTAENWMIWRADTGDVRRHLERGRIYWARTDIPHTATNEHASEGRLHLILDVVELARGG